MPKLQEIQEDTGLLGLLDEQALAALRRLSRSMAYEPGASILRQGELATGAYFLESGNAEASVALPGGGEFSVAELGPGSVLGEMALLDHGICSATVVARSGVNMMVIDRDDFRALIAQRDHAVLKIQHAVTWVLCRKLRALNAKVMQCDAPEDVAVSEAPQALAAALLPLAAGADFDWRRFLPVLPLFQGFSGEEMDEMAALGQPCSAVRGQVIFRAGEAVDASWIVIRGAVEVSAEYESPEGRRRRRLAVLGPGEWLGAMSLLDGAVHGSDAVARENSVFLRIDRAAFDALYYAGNLTAIKVQRAIQRTLLQSTRHTNNQLARLISQGRIRGRHREVPLRELESALYGQFCLLRN